MLIFSHPKHQEKLQKWLTITSARIPVVPVLRRKTANIAALRAKAVAALSSLIVTVVTTRAAAISNCDLHGLTQIDELRGESWSSTFVFMLEKDKRSLPVLVLHPADPVT